MKCEAEDPTGNLDPLCPLVLGLGEACETVGNHGVFLGGGFIAIPLGTPTSLGTNKQTTDGTHDVVELMALEISICWEDPGVAPAQIVEDV